MSKENFKLDVDCRVLRIWAAVIDGEIFDEAQLAVFGNCLRVAYTQGYQDALKEDQVGDRAKLYYDHNYSPPEGTMNYRKRNLDPA